MTRHTRHVTQVEVVTHDRVCHGAVADIPPALARFLGDVSGVAEFVGEKVGSRGHVTRDTGDRAQVMFCRHAACWTLDIRNNTWQRAASLQVRG